jgi:4-hydroxy-tetrahydrodipicolinate reductase
MPERIIKFAIAGAAGRMGRRIVALAAAQPELRCVAAIDAPGSEHIGKDAGELAGIGPIGVRVTERAATEYDVLIDFSTRWYGSMCRGMRRGKSADVIGTGQTTSRWGGFGGARLPCSNRRT